MKHIFLYNTEANQYVVWHGLVQMFLSLELVQQLPRCPLSRVEKHGENVPVETGIVDALDYTLNAQLRTSPLTVIPVGKVNHHWCSATQWFRRKTQSFMAKGAT